ncbi:PREDICTED: AP-3 complex subunit beta-2 isoform X3 [Cercocebus atys]|uniref:AP-3 complex subunit beta-2 isoform X3 n=1 Tax=Cercocebus atys TaxID=9531 RepID=UPI0005F3B84D|nr:PREDICTED: AP-3 complex subunit beta-2 isoform X3 [Cercocebus atys]
MSAAPAYSEDKGGSAGPGEPEYGHDPASGGIFSSDYKRHDDLKEMLDTNKDSLKLEAMKRIVAMIARGKNASDLFPAVVKNVACKNIEVKKLVYVYLVRYAEEQQDLALLSISTFQRGLKDPNQLIRASALRVLSSIRVPIIVPIMMLAIKEAASDMSPYVRKTAAHAIPKLYSLDSDQKDQLIEVIEKLLADKTTLVAGSVVMAFEEVCPERIDLIHKNYRKLCNLLIDVEEWGQVVIISMLTRYARTQFLSPTQNESLLEENAEKAFYGSEEDEAKGAGSEETAAAALPARKPYIMDPDHRLLLRNTKPLLQSRSAAVVMAVAQLYFHLAPKAEVGVIAKALVRLLRSHSEVQYVVLQNVATMSIKRRGMFEPYLKSFYIRSTDPTQIKILKLEVLTNLANETNIPTVLREFQTYIRSMDKDFVAATIQAIGRCATNIGRVRDTCLNGLVQLLSNRDGQCLPECLIVMIRRCLPAELVVAESVVVIKKLLQMQPAQHGEIIKHLAKLTDNIQVPMARASILWLIGEYCEHVPRIAPDVLRKMAKSFTAEEDIVKLQVINLAAKLYLTNSKQVPEWTKCSNREKRKEKEKPFYSDSEGESGPTESADSDPESESESDSKSSSESGSGESSSESDNEDQDEDEEKGRGSESEQSEEDGKRKTKKKKVPEGKGEASSSDEDSDSSSSTSESEMTSESEEEQLEPASWRRKTPPSSKRAPATKEISLLDLEDFTPPSVQPVSPPAIVSTSLAADLEGLTLTDSTLVPSLLSPVSRVGRQELLHRVAGEGLVVDYTFSRQPFSGDPHMVSVHIHFSNSSDTPIKGLHVGTPKLPAGISIQEFPEIESLAPGESATAVMGINFCDSTQAANFQLCTQTRQFYVSIQPPVGELMAPVFMSENEFKKEQGKLMGMNEITEKLMLPDTCRSDHIVVQKVTATANLGRVPCGTSDEYRFAGRTLTSGSLVLLTLDARPAGAAQLTVNSEKMVIGTMLVKDVIQALTQ